MLNKCHIGDCRKLLKEFAFSGVLAQMCVTSPPYYGLRDYGVNGQIGLEISPEDFIAEMVGVFRMVRKVLADDGTLWLNLGDSYNANQGAGFDTNQDGGARKKLSASPKDLLGIPWRVALALQADGWYLRSDIIWHKPNPMPESVTDRPTKSHEYLFLLAKSERYYYDAAAIAEPATNGERFHGAYAAPTPTGPQRISERNGRIDADNTTTERNRRTVWSIPTQPFDGAHFATFPRSLIEPCILAGSRPGDVVLDPFMGSGTTAQVAEHLGRQWIGCELNPDYMPLQARRLAQRAMAF
jgi:DNA modification methylase